MFIQIGHRIYGHAKSMRKDTSTTEHVWTSSWFCVLPASSWVQGLEPGKCGGNKGSLVPPRSAGGSVTLLLASWTNGVWGCCCSQYSVLLKVHSWEHIASALGSMLQGKSSWFSLRFQTDLPVGSCWYQKLELSKSPQRFSRRRTELSFQGQHWDWTTKARVFHGHKSLWAFSSMQKLYLTRLDVRTAKNNKTAIDFLRPGWKL